MPGTEQVKKSNMDTFDQVFINTVSVRFNDFRDWFLIDKDKYEIYNAPYFKASLQYEDKLMSEKDLKIAEFSSDVKEIEIQFTITEPLNTNPSILITKVLCDVDENKTMKSFYQLLGLSTFTGRFVFKLQMEANNVEFMGLEKYKIELDADLKKEK